MVTVATSEDAAAVATFKGAAAVAEMTGAVEAGNISEGAEIERVSPAKEEMTGTTSAPLSSNWPKCTAESTVAGAGEGGFSGLPSKRGAIEEMSPHLAILERTGPRSAGTKDQSTARLRSVVLSPRISSSSSVKESKMIAPPA